MALSYGEEGDPGNMAEDYVWPTLGTAKVKQVLPSNSSVQLVVPHCWELLPD